MDGIEVTSKGPGGVLAWSDGRGELLAYPASFVVLRTVHCIFPWFDKALYLVRIITIAVREMEATRSLSSAPRRRGKKVAGGQPFYLPPANLPSSAMIVEEARRYPLATPVQVSTCPAPFPAQVCASAGDGAARDTRATRAQTVWLQD